MKQTIPAAGVHYLRITENDARQQWLNRHIEDLVSYLDDHGMPVVESSYTEGQSQQCHLLLAYSPENGDNAVYYAAKTYLAECGLDRNHCKVETITNS
ncbi:hypothetical protein [Prevotella dentasini]|uniref:hypothetical protein n=1 Tax=Prevotella dentasini TaxID=589537 RepID=UPI0004695A89|nr:hypothetical protein [Prevotella dentasini]